MSPKLGIREPGESIKRLPSYGGILMDIRSVPEATRGGEHATPEYFINIEGREYEWDKSTITVPEIRLLGKIPADQPIVQEAPDGSERTLAENEVVELKPGHRHGRAPKYKRGRPKHA